MLAALLIAATLLTAPPPSHAHTKVDIEGWTVMVGDPLKKAPKKLYANTKKKLREHLKRIKKVLKPGAVKELQRVVIWAELRTKGFRGLVYHPSSKWLRKNGYDPRKGKAVEMANAAAFVRRTDTPWSVMHELSHAYHHQVLGYSHRGIKQAYQRAKLSGKYAKVKRVNSRPQKHYGMNNEREFFAEMTEAYLGKNDFQPFDRAELKTFDPKTYDLLHSIWGPKLR